MHRARIVATLVLASCGTTRPGSGTATTETLATPFECANMYDEVRIAISPEWLAIRRADGLYTFTMSAEGREVVVRIDILLRRCVRADPQAPPLDPAFPPRYFIDASLNATRMSNGAVLSDEACLEGKRSFIVTAYEYPPSARAAVSTLLATLARVADGTSSPECR